MTNGTRFVLLIVLLLQAHYSISDDSAALQAMKAQWTRFPENWKRVDPCGSNWLGSPATTTKLFQWNLNVEGKLGEAISALSELHIL
ncbi:hypothetical protein DY000_02000411 [Brassica cretica]|uniref:Leucine-rich repeat-containing N-terminal plant-type domain-containing protein n=1 Tax=Brassica cretica TaxID=69181 RepID=A0ABQ7C431_BRACR|nr:hypothetical protein DY000_02000411 [Brassica cretica]